MGISRIAQCCLIVFVICCELTGSKKVTSRDKNGIKSNKLSECRRCTILTDSFKHWIDKTSRGKYEGGDAAWEEAKLKSYSRSEIRLVEIQEGLCSELKIHQDACYALAEEVELVLEKWWFHEDPSAVELYTWLCIENLKHCCPEGHYGESCSPCLKDTDNKICGGTGRCDGDGTRNGNGTCLCKKGYTGLLCDECGKNYYLTESGACERCHRSCSGCTGGEANACEGCKTGWQLTSGQCIDIDECTGSVCKDNEYCNNIEGSYKCKECDTTCRTCTGEGPYNCTSCESNNILWFSSCIDEQLKQSIVAGIFKRLALYIGLITISMFILNKSKSIASISVLIVAVFIYLSEKSLRMTTIDVFQHMMFSSN